MLTLSHRNNKVRKPAIHIEENAKLYDLGIMRSKNIKKSCIVLLNNYCFIIKEYPKDVVYQWANMVYAVIKKYNKEFDEYSYHIINTETGEMVETEFNLYVPWSPNTRLTYFGKHQTNTFGFVTKKDNEELIEYMESCDPDYYHSNIYYYKETNKNVKEFLKSGIFNPTKENDAMYNSNLLILEENSNSDYMLSTLFNYYKEKILSNVVR